MAKKQRYANGYFRGCYRDLDKTWMCGETLTLKEVLDEWWNNVSVKTEDGNVHHCWKNAYACDGYELDGLPKSILKRDVEVADCWDEDSDGYLIVSVKVLPKA